MNVDADVRIDENGDTWIRIDTPFGRYEYNKTRMDASEAALKNLPISIGV